MCELTFQGWFRLRALQARFPLAPSAANLPRTPTRLVSLVSILHDVHWRVFLAYDCVLHAGPLRPEPTGLKRRHQGTVADGHWVWQLGAEGEWILRTRDAGNASKYAF